MSKDESLILCNLVSPLWGLQSTISLFIFKVSSLKHCNKLSLPTKKSVSITSVLSKGVIS